MARRSDKPWLSEVDQDKLIEAWHVAKTNYKSVEEFLSNWPRISKPLFNKYRTAYNKRYAKKQAATNPSANGPEP
jgi:hypothetical protein